MRNESLKCWKDLTDSEKWEILLAKYEGKKIEALSYQRSIDMTKIPYKDWIEALRSGDYEEEKV